MLDEIVDLSMELDSFQRKGEIAWVKTQDSKSMMVDSAKYFDILNARFPDCTEKQLKRAIYFLGAYTLRTADCEQVKREATKKRFNPDAKQPHYTMRNN